MRMKRLTTIVLLLLSAGIALAAIRPPAQTSAVAAPAAEAKAPSGESWQGRSALYTAMLRWLGGSKQAAYDDFQSGVYAALQRAVTDEKPDALCDYGILLMNGIFFVQDLPGGYAEIVRAAEKGSDLAARIVKEAGK